MGKQIKKEIPEGAFEFQSSGVFEFADSEDKNNFRLTLYDGSVVNHWFWGNMAFDLETMKLAKPKIPVLDSHDTQRRVGIADKASFDGKFELEGKFLSNAIAQEIRKDAAEGYPFEASLYFDPRKTKIEQIAEGVTVTVNGNKLTGPGAVMRKAVILEGSIVTFGALGKTKTVTFEQITEQEINIMSDEKMTKAAFATAHPEIYAATVSEGEANVRAEFGKFCAQFGDDPAFLVEQFKAGVSMTEAIAAENKKLKAQQAERAKNAAGEQQQQQQQQQQQTGEKVDPAVQEFSDQQKPPEKPADEKTNTTEKFMGIARAYAEQHKCKVSEAISKCTVTHRKEHQAMLDENTVVEERRR